MANERNDSKKPSSIDDALKVLDDALDGVNAPALGALVSDQFNNVKAAIGNSGIGEFSQQSFEQISEVAAIGLENARRIGGEVDRSVRANPWPFLGGVAVGTLALGVILGRSQARSI